MNTLLEKFQYGYQVLRGEKLSEFKGLLSGTVTDDGTKTMVMGVFNFRATLNMAMGTATAKDKKEEFLSQIIQRLNEIFLVDELTENDLVNYAHTIRDKLSENKLVMKQIANNSPEQAMLGGFSKAIDDAILDSSDAHRNQMMQLLSNPDKAKSFARVVFDLLSLAK